MTRSLLAMLLLTLVGVGCGSQSPRVSPVASPEFQSASKGERVQYPDAETLAAFEADVDPVYRLGPGDVLTIDVWNRPELSGKHTLGPDGRIGMPMLGTLKLTGLTREAADSMITEGLQQYYKRPIVELRIDEYHANRITILGRVLNPGVHEYDTQPLLLDVLARAGSLPVLDKQATLTRCAVFRGREQIIWIDLKQLLNRGELAYNIRLKPNDLVYIPDSFDTLVYVLGAVEKPGAYRLTPDMSLLDVLAQAGGPNEDANADEMALYRPGMQESVAIDLGSLMSGQRPVDFALEEGDVLFVPEKGIARTGYVLRQLLPGLSFLTWGSAVGGN
jgi:polysaccharide export outer membrane protein